MQPATGPSDTATTRLLDTIRTDAPRGVLVTGTEAIYADVSQRLADRLWLGHRFRGRLSRCSS